MKLSKLITALKKEKINYMIVGGYAVNFHGFSRNTVDIDLIIKFTLANLKKLEKLLKSMGMVSRLPIDAISVFKFRDEYIKNRNLIAWNFYNELDPTDQVDILINHDMSDFNFEKFRVGELVYKVISKKDLIKMKQKSGRHKDLLDIKELTKMKDATKQIEWLEAMRELNKAKKVEKQILISLKIDPHFLNVFKLKCQLENRPYTTKIKELMKNYLET